MDKPDYIVNLEKEVKKLSESHKELKANHDNDSAIHGQILNKLTSIDNTQTSIDHTLRGTKQDPGGLVEEVHNNTECVEKMNRNQAKRDGLVGSLVASVSLGLTIAWNAIVNSPK